MPASVFAQKLPKRGSGLRRDIHPDVPPFSVVHDANSSALLAQLGLVTTWNVIGSRFTAAGRGLLLATGVFFVSGVNALELQAHVPLLYVCCLWAIAGFFMWRMKPRCEIRVRCVERISAGEELPVEIEVVSRRDWAAAQVRIVPTNLPRQIEIEQAEGAPLPAMAQGATATVNLKLRPRQRGVFVIEGWRTITDYPFGLLRALHVIPGAQRILVYPRFTPLSHLTVPAGRQFQPGGLAMIAHTGDSFEFQGNREYRDGDSVRSIDWRATARLSRPIVREYREEFFLRAAVILDTHLAPAGTGRGAGRRPSPGDTEAFERAVSLCAAIGEYMARSDYIVDLLAAGPNLYHLVTGRSEAYLDQILDILACVEPSATSPFAVLEPEIASNLSRINTIICVFLDWDEERRLFVEALLREGAGLRLFIVREETPSLDPYTGPYASFTSVLSPQQVDEGVVLL